MKSFKQGIFALLISGAILALGACDFLFIEESSSPLTSSNMESSIAQESFPTYSQEIEISIEEESALDSIDSVLEPESSLEESSIEDSSIDESFEAQTSEDPSIDESFEEESSFEDSSQSSSESSNGGFELPEDKFD